jgi:hypothetical protein
MNFSLWEVKVLLEAVRSRIWLLSGGQSVKELIELREVQTKLLKSLGEEDEEEENHMAGSS